MRDRALLFCYGDAIRKAYLVSVLKNPHGSYILRKLTISGGAMGLFRFSHRNTRCTNILKKGILVEAMLVMILATVVLGQSEAIRASAVLAESDYIKWVDFSVSYEALCRAYEWDVDTHGTDHEINWIELLAYTAAKSGGEFSKSALKTLNSTAEKLSAGETTIEELAKDMKYYSYYKEAYGAALGGLVGEYREEIMDENGECSYKDCYGLKGYFPLARGFDYSHYDDFGAGRSYGYQRRHLGHDMMGLVGTPI